MPINYGPDYGIPTLDLNFTKNKSLIDTISGRNLITFTRSSTGTYVGSDGLIKTAASNEPRFDHNPVTGESLGLLIEESRTNLLTYSEQLDNGVWSLTNGTVTANSVTSPDGTTTADAITPSASFRLRQNYTGTVTNPTFSVYVKPNTATDISVSIVGSVEYEVTFNFATRTFNTIGSNVTQYGYHLLPNGWYRVWIGAASYTFTGANGPGFRGDFGSFYAWGAQLEAGSFPTSYIPTSGTTLTRSADTASITGTNFSSWYNQNAGTVLFQSDQVTTTDNVTAISISDGTSNQRIRILFRTADRGRAYITSSGVDSLDQTITQAGTRYALGFSSASATFSKGGLNGTEDTSVVIPAVSQLELLSNQRVSRLTYYPKRLPNDQLQVLTR